MTRVRLYLVGCVILVALAGCGRSFLQFAQRAPWRHDAEVACLQSGAVKPGAGVVQIEPIEGPGVCGADFPLKVAALGQASAFSFADDLRPPAAIPSGGMRQQPPWPLKRTYSVPSSPVLMAPNPSVAEPDADLPPQEAGGIAPMSIHPGNDPGRGETIGRPSSVLSRPAPMMRPRRTMQEASPAIVPLAPLHGAPLTRAIGPVELKPAATLACPIVSALDHWINEAVQPAAMRWFGQPVVTIKQISAYSCRGMNGNPHAHISEHAFGNALDVAAFVLADGRKITVQHGWHGTPEEQGFLHDVQGAACQDFTTVLSPGYNVYHYDHIHVDLMRRSRGRHVCRPAAIPGEVAAARAAKHRGAYASRKDVGVTGSIGRHADEADETAPPDDEDVIEELIEEDGRPQTPRD